MASKKSLLDSIQLSKLLWFINHIQPERRYTFISTILLRFYY